MFHVKQSLQSINNKEGTTMSKAKKATQATKCLDQVIQVTQSRSYNKDYYYPANRQAEIIVSLLGKRAKCINNETIPLLKELGFKIELVPTQTATVAL